MDGTTIDTQGPPPISDPADPRLFVPVPDSTDEWQVNFAHRWAWPMIVATAGVPSLILVALMWGLGDYLRSIGSPWAAY